jgi:branched-chain amino acid transport system permease protein
MTDVAPANLSAGGLVPSSRGRARVLRHWLRLPRQPLLRHLTLALIGAGILYFVTAALSQYNNYLAGEIAVYLVALAGLSVLTGISGQISLGHGAFMAVGAYTVALLMTHTQINFILELLISIGTAAVLGLAVGISSTRLRGPYLAGMTLLVALALPPIADKWNSVFGGDQGLTTTVPTAPGSINSYQWLAWIEMAGALLTLVVLANLLRSRFGRAFRAVRDDEVAAALAGVHVARTKVTAFVVSAACAGLAGAFLALSTGVVNTGEFPLTLSIQLLAAMVLAGSGSLIGMVWGAVLLVYVPQWSTSFSGRFNLGSGASAYLATIFFGAVLVLVMIAAPSGIQGGLRKLWDRVSMLWLRARNVHKVPAPLVDVASPDRE